MTLVVARRTGDQIRILSDSRITTATARPLNGALKTVIVSPTVCVSYAGTHAWATHAIRAAVDRNAHNNCELITRRLLAASADGPLDTSFIVAGLEPRTRLLRVESGRCDDNLLSAWIGNHDAFEAYQEGFHSYAGMTLLPEIASEEEAARFTTAARMSEGFRAVLEAAKHGVTEPISRVASTPIGFKYLMTMAGYDAQPIASATTPTSIITPTDAASGGFNFTLLTPSSVGVGVIGIYFLQGEFGWLFRPLIADEAIVYARCSCDQFIESVRTEHGIALDGFRFT